VIIYQKDRPPSKPPSNNMLGMVGIRGVLVLACSLRAEGMKYAVGGRAISTNNRLPIGIIR